MILIDLISIVGFGYLHAIVRNGVGAWLLIFGHHGWEAPDPESPPMKYSKRSQYKYAKSRYRQRIEDTGDENADAVALTDRYRTRYPD